MHMMHMPIKSVSRRDRASCPGQDVHPVLCDEQLMLELCRPGVRLGRIRPPVDPAVTPALVALDQARLDGETVTGLHEAR